MSKKKVEKGTEEVKAEEPKAKPRQERFGGMEQFRGLSPHAIQTVLADDSLTEEQKKARLEELKANPAARGRKRDEREK